MRTRGHVSLNLKRVFRPCGLAGYVVLILVCGQSTNAMAYAEGSFQRTLHVTGPVNLDVSTGSGSIQIRTGGSNQVQVTGHIKTRDWLGGNGEEKVKQIQANPPIQQSGNIIRIGHIDDSELRRNVSISYELVVPGETQLHSQTGSGNQTVEGIRKSIEVGTGSGGLRITDIGETVRAATGSGGVQLRFPSDAAFDLDAHTSSGSISVDRPVTVQGTMGRKQNRGKVRGGGVPVEVETGSGNIEIQ